MLMVKDEVFTPQPQPPHTGRMKKMACHGEQSVAQERLELAAKVYKKGGPSRQKNSRTIREKVVASGEHRFGNSVCSNVSSGSLDATRRNGRRLYSPGHLSNCEALAMTAATMTSLIPNRPEECAEAPAPSEVPGRTVTATSFRKYMDDMDTQLNDIAGNLGENTRGDSGAAKRMTALKAKHESSRLEARATHHTGRKPVQRGAKGAGSGVKFPTMKRTQARVQEAAHFEAKRLRLRAKKAEPVLKEQSYSPGLVAYSTANIDGRLATTVVEDHGEAANEASLLIKAKYEMASKSQVALEEQQQPVMRRRKSATANDSSSLLDLQKQATRQQQLEVELESTKQHAMQQSEQVEQLRATILRLEAELEEAKRPTHDDEVEHLRAMVSKLEEHVKRSDAQFYDLDTKYRSETTALNNALVQAANAKRRSDEDLLAQIQTFRVENDKLRSQLEAATVKNAIMSENRDSQGEPIENMTKSAAARTMGASQQVPSKHLEFDKASDNPVDQRGSADVKSSRLGGLVRQDTGRKLVETATASRDVVVMQAKFCVDDLPKKQVQAMPNRAISLLQARQRGRKARRSLVATKISLCSLKECADAEFDCTDGRLSN